MSTIARPKTPPRGNTMILVTAILVLLVIIAVAFLSRTQAGRQVSAAQQQATQRDDRALSIANELADLIGESLFPQPVDPGAAFRALDIDDPDSPRTAVSSWPRLATPASARRYGIDRDVNDDFRPDFAYNAATYAVSPWTNWPDFLSPIFPRGPGQPDGLIVNPAGVPIGDGNPYGNPGYGDTRWLRSTEPVRVDRDDDGVPDWFSHWNHLSWIPTANNGWRVVKDISDITGTVLTNLNETDLTQPFALGMPYEQWLPNVFPAVVSSPNNFIQRRDAWFGLPTAYATNYATPAALPNFFRLHDLSANPLEEFVPGTPRNVVGRTFTDTDGDGFTDSFWFLAPTSVERGVRTLVGVSIVDNSSLLNVNVATRFDRTNTAGTTPGDLALVSDVGVGFLDCPTNSMASANAPYPTLWPATANSLYPPVYVGWNQLYFGDLDNPGDGLSFLQAIGMKNPIDFGQPNGYLSDFSLSADRRGEFHSPIERLGYFRSLVDPLEPQFGLTPFGTSEELELRMFHGNNHPFVMSRFERALNRREPQPGSSLPERWFLRSSAARAETSEYLDQLDARQLLLDNRRKLTMFSGSRNDLLPPWLWPTSDDYLPSPALIEGLPPSGIFDTSIDYNRRDGAACQSNPDSNECAEDRLAFELQMRKLDLRRAMDRPEDYPIPTGTLGQPIRTRIERSRREWRQDLERLLRRSLVRRWEEPSETPSGDPKEIYQSYLGGRKNPDDEEFQRTQFQKTLSMAAAWTANIDQARDRAQVPIGNILVDQPLYPSLDFAVPDPIDDDLVHIGQEKQPYIMEVFVALVYPKSKISQPLKAALQAAGLPVPASDYDVPSVFKGGGEHFVDSSSRPIPVIAVQIANPHDTPVNLIDFRLRLFGKVYNFNVTPPPPATNPPLFESYGVGPQLGPATASGPSTAIVYAMKAPAADQLGAFPTGWNAATFKDKWRDFLDIDDQALFNSGDGIRRTLRFDASTVWATEETPSPAESDASLFNDEDGQSIELVRNIASPIGVGLSKAVVVDRFDNYEASDGHRFAAYLSRLFKDPKYFPPKQKFEITPGSDQRTYMDGLRIGDDDFYVAWTRASRAWRWDVPKDADGDGTVGLGEGTDDRITPDEDNPRWVFSFASEPVLPTGDVRANINGEDRSVLGNTIRGNQPPDAPNLANLWIPFSYMNIHGKIRRGKPVFFTNQVVQPEGATEEGENRFGGGFIYPDPNGNYPGDVVIGDKGFQAADWERAIKSLSLRAPLQMLNKDADFTRVGELLDVFCWGPVIDAAKDPPETVRTFSEIMMQEDDDEDQPAGRGVFVNRLRILSEVDPTVAAERSFRTNPQSTDGPTAVLGTPPLAPFVPALPAGASLFDAFVCDDRGHLLDGIDGSAPNNLLSVSEANVERFRPRNAVAFSGKSTPGLLNLNTALPEVLRAMPQMHFLVSNPANFGTVAAPDAVTIPFVPGSSYVRVADSIIRYRERSLGDEPGVIVPPQLGAGATPGYADRGAEPDQVPGAAGGFFGPLIEGNEVIQQGMRNERGIQSVGELMLLQRIGSDSTSGEWSLNRSFSIQYLGLDPYRSSVSNPGASGHAYANGVAARFSTDLQNGRDRVGGDAEERNLLLSGISNLVTTRSDIFTVHFRIRSVRQDPVTRKWDGANPDLIVDDSRYVMTVDRGSVDRPGQRPRILMLEKCPD